MKNPKGFVWMPVLFLVLGALFIGGSAYFFAHRQSTPQNSGYQSPSNVSSTENSVPNQTPAGQADIEIIFPKGGETLLNNQQIEIQYATSDALKQKITSTDKVELYLLDSKNILTGYIGALDVNRTMYVWYTDRLYHNAGLDAIIKVPPAGQYRIVAIASHRVKPDCTACDIGVSTFDSPYASFSNGKLYYSGKLNSTQPIASGESDVFAIKDGPVDTSGSVSKYQGKYIHLSDIVSYRNNGTFSGNDPITFSWTTNYLTLKPVFYMANKTTGELVYSKVLGGGTDSSSAKFGESTPSNLNFPTGIYDVQLCDIGVKDATGYPLCTMSNSFNITATTTPYQP